MGVCFSVDGTTGVAACERLIVVHAQRTKNRTQMTAETTAAASLRDLLNDNFTFPVSVEKLGTKAQPAVGRAAPQAALPA